MAGARYADGTDVSEDRSIQEIRRELLRFGATGFMYGEQGNRRMVAFEYAHLRIQLDLTLPRRDESFVDHRGYQRRMSVDSNFEQEIRRRWRSLALVIKAKLVAITDGVSTFEREFLAFVVLPDGGTIGDRIADDLQHVVTTGDLAPLLPAARVIALGSGNGKTNS